MGKIIQFPVTEEARRRLAARQEDAAARKETEKALRRDGFILLAWAREGSVLGCLRGWYLPEDGRGWVYVFSYDAKTMKECGSVHRAPLGEIYRWLQSDKKGLFREFHLCAPPFILLDSKDLRAEYLAGNIG
jgi:hypothetical protein